MADNPMPSSMPETFREEKALQKIGRKIYQEPLIPFGCALTVWALYQASRSIRAGDHDRTNRMFRMRIYGQAFTIVAMVAGSYYYAEERAKRKEFDGTVAERKAKEKQEAWIRELEHRQREEQEIARQMEAMHKRRQEAMDQSTNKNVKSALEERECRRLGILEAVRELSPSWR